MKSVGLALFVLFVPALALADGTAPATVMSDYDPLVIKLPTERSVIDLKSYRLDVRGAAGSHSKDGSTSRVELLGGKKLILGGKGDLSESIRTGVSLYAGGSGRADFARGPGDARIQNQNLEIHGGGLAYSMSVVNRDPVQTDKANFTLGIDDFHSEYFYRRQPAAGVEAHGLKTSLARLSTHGAVKVAGLPIDLCAQAAVGAVVGAVKLNDQKTDRAWFYEAEGCVGVGLGQVGHLGYDYRIGAISDGGLAGSISQSHELSLRKIAGTPLSVSIRHEKADTTTYTTDEATSKKIPHERGYSASFASVAAEF